MIDNIDSKLRYKMIRLTSLAGVKDKDADLVYRGIVWFVDYDEAVQAKKIVQKAKVPTLVGERKMFLHDDCNDCTAFVLHIVPVLSKQNLEYEEKVVGAIALLEGYLGVEYPGDLDEDMKTLKVKVRHGR